MASGPSVPRGRAGPQKPGFPWKPVHGTCSVPGSLLDAERTQKVEEGLDGREGFSSSACVCVCVCARAHAHACTLGSTVTESR